MAGIKVRTLRVSPLGLAVIGVVVLLAIIAVPVLLLFGAAEFSVWTLGWIPDLIGAAALVSLALVPLAFIPATRGLAGGLFGFASLLFGISLWLYALASTYIEWGMLGVILGVLLAGIGVVFTGILAALFSASWGVLGNIAVLLALSVVTRFAASFLRADAARRYLRKRTQENPSEAIIDQPGGDDPR